MNEFIHFIWKMCHFYTIGTGLKKNLPLIQEGMAVKPLNTYILESYPGKSFKAQQSTES